MRRRSRARAGTRRAGQDDPHQRPLVAPQENTSGPKKPPANPMLPATSAQTRMRDPNGSSGTRGVIGAGPSGARCFFGQKYTIKPAHASASTSATTPARSGCCGRPGPPQSRRRRTSATRKPAAPRRISRSSRSGRRFNGEESLAGCRRPGATYRRRSRDSCPV